MSTRVRRPGAKKGRVVSAKIAKPKKSSSTKDKTKSVEKKERAPNKRDLYTADDRRLFDGSHPGPIYGEIKATHYAQDVPGVEFEHRPDDTLTIQTAKASSGISRILLYFRCTAKNTIAQPCISGQRLTLVNLTTNTSVKVKITQWFQKSKYRSGYCIVASTT